jgi:hypothetical protein
LTAKTEDQTAWNIGLQGQCAYLSKYLMKYEPWPSKKKALPAVEETTPEAPKNNHQELVVIEAN